MSRKQETAGEILAGRIGKRLAGLAAEMAHDRLGAWADLKDALLTLDEDSFQVIYDLRSYNGPVLAAIEQAVNQNTNQLVRDTQGAFSFGSDFTAMFDPGEASLITFDPEHCEDSRARYAALMVVQRFESLLQSVPAHRPGRLHPAGTFIGGHYGVIISPSFGAFAYSVNGALGKHALPEDHFGAVDFRSPGGQAPSTPYRPRPGL